MQDVARDFLSTIPDSRLFSVHRSPRSIGIYHLSATGHTSRYEFTKAIIRIMKEVSGVQDGWASVKPITSDQYPLPATRPRFPITNKGKIKRVFGIETPRWEDQLRSCMADLVSSSEQGPRAKTL